MHNAALSWQFCMQSPIRTCASVQGPQQRSGKSNSHAPASQRENAERGTFYKITACAANKFGAVPAQNKISPRATTQPATYTLFGADRILITCRSPHAAAPTRDRNVRHRSRISELSISEYADAGERATRIHARRINETRESATFDERCLSHILTAERRSISPPFVLYPRPLLIRHPSRKGVKFRARRING